MRWISALNLQQWADTLSARTVFPGMIADLIRASADNIASIRFPNGDKGQVRGFDGTLEAIGVPPYIPDGLSIWEFGVSDGATTKANSDYKKRTAEVDEATRKVSTFVFVTPRTWDNQNQKLVAWINDKKKLLEWKDVVYLDGAMVEDWLAQCPAVAARYARYELRHLPAIGARSTEEFWDEYSTRFEPPLVEQVLLAGRAEQAVSLIQQLGEGVSRLLYAADSPDEVIAFAIAAIRSADPSVRFFLEAKALVVETEESARQLASIEGLVFFPRAKARNLTGLLAQKGPTIVSAGADDKKHDHEVLIRPTSLDLGNALTSMGFSEQEGYDIARRCGRSLAVLARQKPSGTAARPEWQDNGAQLIPALLAGAWHALTKSDQDIVCVLAASEKYNDFEAPLRMLTKLQDPPIDHVSGVWAMRASVDAFVYLGHLIGPEHLERFAEAARIVFSQIDDFPKAEDKFKPFSERIADTHSRWLRDGMMNTLLHMSVLHEQAEFVVDGMTPQAFVNNVVRSIPGLSSDYRLMASLQDQLALLAEAAPSPFLEALECLLEGDAAGIRPIFEEHKGLISPSSYHYGILWGLELLAWDPQLLLRVSLCLARLAEVDPGGSVSNRPINSLRTIFLSWSPNTSATAKQRRAALGYILRQVPSIAWMLITKLLPSSYDSSTPTQRPTFREFGDRNAEVLTYGLVWESQIFIIDMGIQHAGLDPERWVILINAIANFPKQALENLTKELNEVLMRIEPEARFVIWDALRKEVRKHRACAHLDWALSEEVLAQFDLLIDSFTPQSIVERSIWLFDDWSPYILGKIESDSDPAKMIESARQEAILEIMKEEGVSGLIELAKKVKLPQHVAAATRILEMDFDSLADFFTRSLCMQPSLNAVSNQIMVDGVSRFGSNWMSFSRTLMLNKEIEPKLIVSIITSLEETMETWNYVREFGGTINDTYWQLKQPFFIRGSVDELLFAVQNYFLYNRPLAALDAASQRMFDLPSSILVLLLDKAVNEINESKNASSFIGLYNIGEAFKELRSRVDVSPNKVAELELRYLPVIGNSDQSLTLHSLIVEQPTLFINAICTVFKPASGEPIALPEEAKQLVLATYELLNGLRLLPGQTGSEVDQQTLLNWCTEVRELAVEVDRVKITDQKIGGLLAHAPSSPKDNVWPHESVRSVIEQLASSEVENGLTLERFNMRGVYSKAIGEGGRQERVLAQQAKEWAESMPDYPRTAAVLMRISERWLVQARQEDQSAARESLRM